MFQTLSPSDTLNLEKGYQKDSSLDKWSQEASGWNSGNSYLSSPLWHMANQDIFVFIFCGKPHQICQGRHAPGDFYQAMSSCWSRSHAFPMVVPAPWSSLPPELQMAPTLLTFIKEIKTWLFPQAFGWLNEFCYELAGWFYCSGKFGVIFLDPGTCGLLALYCYCFLFL